jgi:hypothetical protein
MKLNCFERIVAINLLALFQEGNFVTFKTIAGLKDKLFVNEQEVKDFELVLNGNEYQWNTNGNTPVEIEITEGEKKIVADKLLELDKDNKLTPQLVPLYEKFVV